MNKTRNTLPPHKQAVVMLNNTVAKLFDLFARIKYAHWNVKLTEAEDFRKADLLTNILEAHLKQQESST